MSDQNKQRGNRPPKSRGRPKGSPNKTTALLKDAILQAAAVAGKDEGLIGYLTTQATLNPGPFMSLLGKVLPTQLTGDPANPIQTVTRIERQVIDPSQDVADSDAAEIPTSH